MALGFLKKVFSFGRKEAEQRPAEDEPLAPLNLDALKDFAAEAPPPPSPLEGEVPAEQAEGVVEDARDALAARDIKEQTPSPAEVPPSGPPVSPPVEAPDVPRAVEAILADHLPLKGGEEPAPSEPGPQPTSELPQEPAPVEIPAPSPPAAPPPSPLRGGSSGLDRDTDDAVVRDDSAAIQAGRGGVADGARDSDLQPVQSVELATPSAAATTVSGPPVSPPAAAPDGPGVVGAIQADHLPLEGGEEARPASPLPGKVTVGRAVEKKVEAAPAAPAPEPRKSWFQRLRDGLSRSSRELTGSIAGIFTKRKLDEDTLEELEDVLIRADLGMETALRVTDTLASSRYGKDVSDTEVRAIMAQEVEKVLTPVAKALELDLSHKPHVILVVGVNGTGKTTTIGKLAAKLSQGGLSVMLAAGDTFRAAAIEQLKIWGERTGSPVVSSKLGADAAGLAWDAFEKAKEAGSDVLIIDTAGRLQNKAELMAELEKIVRVLGKHDPEAPHTVLQTVDATTGQNALNQVEIFRNVAGVNGLVMTKLDGTARGGILVAIAAKHKLPVYFIGVGEQVDDLEPFSASDFARAIAGVG